MNTKINSLGRFIQAQKGSYNQALTELKAGHKRSHWIWYILPQLRGLGRSQTSFIYGIANREEAIAYLAHPILGTRLIECVAAILKHRNRTAVEMLGDIDAMKFRSCLTLFAAVAPHEQCFSDALRILFNDVRDPETLRLLDKELS